MNSEPPPNRGPRRRGREQASSGPRVSSSGHDGRPRYASAHSPAERGRDCIGSGASDDSQAVLVTVAQNTAPAAAAPPAPVPPEVKIVGGRIGERQGMLGQDVSEQALAMRDLFKEFGLFKIETADKLDQASAEMGLAAQDLPVPSLPEALEHGKKALALLEEAAKSLPAGSAGNGGAGEGRPSEMSMEEMMQLAKIIGQMKQLNARHERRGPRPHAVAGRVPRARHVARPAPGPHPLRHRQADPQTAGETAESRRDPWTSPAARWMSATPRSNPATPARKRARPRARPSRCSRRCSRTRRTRTAAAPAAAPHAAMMAMQNMAMGTHGGGFHGGTQRPARARPARCGRLPRLDPAEVR